MYRREGGGKGNDYPFLCLGWVMGRGGKWVGFGFGQNGLSV